MKQVIVISALLLIPSVAYANGGFDRDVPSVPEWECCPCEGEERFITRADLADAMESVTEASPRTESGPKVDLGSGDGRMALMDTAEDFGEWMDIVKQHDIFGFERKRMERREGRRMKKFRRSMRRGRRRMFLRS